MPPIEHNQIVPYDLIAIGSGPAAESATELASLFGRRCIVIERDKPGGAVTTTGGVPTKTLREAALYYTGFRNQDSYGLNIKSPPEVVLDLIRKRTRQVSESLQRATAQNFKRRGVAYLQGRARLGPNHSVLVETDDGQVRTLLGKVILIATGSRPSRTVSGLPIGHPGICDTDTILKRGFSPKELLIIGGGPVAAEFATIARSLDIGVTIVCNSSRLLTMMDEEMARALSETMESWGVKVLPNTTLNSASADGDILTAFLSNGASVVVDTIFFAAGRVGNSEDLDLDMMGVERDEKGCIKVNDQFCTSVPGIYAAGDVIGPTLASVAMEQGRHAICAAFGIPVEGVIDEVQVSAVYSMPEIARVGLTEEECIERALDYEIGRADFEDIPRGAIAGRGGKLKLIFLKDSRRVIGVHCIGDIASEIVGIGQVAIKCGATIHTFVNMTMNTPTYSHAYKYAALDGLSRLAASGIQPLRRLTGSKPNDGTTFLTKSEGYSI